MRGLRQPVLCQPVEEPSHNGSPFRGLIEVQVVSSAGDLGAVYSGASMRQLLRVRGAEVAVLPIRKEDRCLR
jgi:hypothetical protein